MLNTSCSLLTLAHTSLERTLWSRVLEFLRSAEAADITHIADKLRVAFPSPLERAMVRGVLRQVMDRVVES